MEDEEAEALDRVAEWRLRLLDADPTDRASAEAARLLARLAAALRAVPDHPLRTELAAICHWLGESDAISDFAIGAEAYRARIGIDCHPANAEDHLRALIALANQAM
ncbi:MAG: hypothetical protein KGI51_07575 [Rhodospirillales bacterium]|nr:hypothetical protein [Rhodospirillales bacterium]